MPACFTLTRKTDPEAGPVDLIALDEEICAAFDQPVDPDRFVFQWYDAIGLLLAAGVSWDRIRETLSDCPPLPVVASWLEERFEVDSWKRRGG